MRKAIVTLMCVVAVVCMAVTAGAERGRPFSVSPFIGGYTFEGNENVKANLDYGLRVGYNLTDAFTLEGVLNYVPTEFKDRSEKVTDLGIRMEALYHFMPRSRFVPFLAVGIGGRILNSERTESRDHKNVLADYGLGLKYYLTEALAVRADVRHLVTFNDRYNNLEYTLGLTYLFGGEPAPAPAARTETVVVDSDGDGVPDVSDDCPGTPSGVRVDNAGCPLDSDGDGVYDYLDRCPDTPKGVKVGANGCPLDTDGDGVTDDRDLCPNTFPGAKVDRDGCPLDSDKDGVSDAADQCPNTPLGASVDSRGCPLDTDGDGVYDYLDKCPDTPKGVKVDSSGCPLDKDQDGVADYWDKCPGTPAGVKVDGEGCPLDTDGDGVYDYLDKCPGTPKGVKVEKDGCPPPVLEERKQEAQAQAQAVVAPVAAPAVAPVVKRMAKEKEAIALHVEFDTNKSVVKPKYHDEIKAVADFMKEYPHSKATIEGHTDNVGKASSNKRLSQSRAESVRQYLIDNFGIDGARLTAVGYGEERPIASNATKAGQKKNRRVEAIIESTDK